MKIGVTGGTGFIGSYLIKMYSSTYDFVIATSKESKMIDGVEYRHTEYDLEGFKHTFRDCSAVIHLGARIQFDLNYEKQTFYKYESNITTTESLFEACHDLGIKNIIFASSTAVYEKNSTINYTEDMETNPLTYYGLSKVCCEKLAHIYNTSFGMSIKCLRFSYVLGVNYSESGERQLPNIYIRNAIAGHELPVYGSGITSTVYIYVKDVVNAIIKAIEHENICGIFNIGNSYNTSNLELAQIISNEFSKKNLIAFYPEKKESGIIWRMNCDKAKRILGFEPKYSVIDAIRDMKRELQ